MKIHKILELNEDRIVVDCGGFKMILPYTDVILWRIQQTCQRMAKIVDYNLVNKSIDEKENGRLENILGRLKGIDSELREIFREYKVFDDPDEYEKEWEQDFAEWVGEEENENE